MKKKLFTLLLAVAAGVGTMFAWDYERVHIGDLYYNLDATNQTAEVTSQNSSYPYWSTSITTANIPASVEFYDGVGYSVTSIGKYAFFDCTGLTSVTIGNSVTSIGKYAFFDCTGLTSVTIGNSVTSIGDMAFSGCTGLTSVTIGNSVTSIGDMAFLYCTRLTSVTIGNSVTSIGDRAFYGCSSLTSITIPNSVTSIGNNAFRDCSGLTSPVYNAHVFAYMPTSYSGAYTIPDGIESIAGYAFDGCRGLTSVTIPNSVTSIGEGAFFFCSSLTSVTIPNSVTSIGYAAFAYCSSLTSINVETNNPNYCSVEGVLFNKDKTRLIQYPGGKQGAYTIPNSVTSIVDRAFSGCTGLTSVTIPNSVTSIGSSAFESCSGLTSVTIPNSVTSIGSSAFRECRGLKNVMIPNSVTSIGNSAFYGCSGLKNVILGTSVKVLEQNAFFHCSSIETITCYGQRPPTVNQNALYGLDYSTIVYVPADYLETYKMHDAWGLYDVRPLGAKSTETTDVNVTPAENTAEVAWPAVSGAATYELVIKDKSGNVICTLIFNANGQLTQIAFHAPSRNNAPQQTQAAGFSFTVTGLEEGTSYDLTITSKDNNGGTLDTKTISFTTTGESQGIDNTPFPSGEGRGEASKVISNGQIFILRGDKTYTLTGQETIMP